MLQRMIKRMRQLRNTRGENFNLRKVLQFTEEDNTASTERDFLSPSADPIATPAQLVCSIASFYDPTVYAYCIFDMARILHQAANEMQNEMLRHPELLLVSPYRLIKNPRHFPQSIGKVRFKALQGVLLSLFSYHEASPDSLTQKALRESPSGTSFVPFFRGLALCSSVSHSLSDQASYVFEALLTEGIISEELWLEGEYYDRALTLSRLFMATAQEFGSSPMLNASISLSRQVGIEITYPMSKKICLAFTRTGKRRLDWSFKGSSHFKTIFSAKRGWNFGNLD